MTNMHSNLTPLVKISVLFDIHVSSFEVSFKMQTYTSIKMPLIFYIMYMFYFKEIGVCNFNVKLRITKSTLAISGKV